MNCLKIVPYPSNVKVISDRFFQGKDINERTQEMLREEDTIKRTQEIPEEEDSIEKEGYRLTISEEKILLEGSQLGVLYGRRTLEQLVMQFGNKIPCMEIEDKPQFSYRGFMLDSCRHFFLVEDVKVLLQAASFYKLNRMHWHLSDDQGFRIEIKAYPKLTEIGSKRAGSSFGRIQESGRENGFYTQEDIKEVVTFAKKLGIEIIPEIEIPGHESALLAAYPEAGCMGELVAVQTRGGIFDNLLCAGKEESWKIITGILDEVMQLFPYDWIHIGGDEACKRKWRACPDCQRKMKELGCKDENALQQWFNIRVKDYLVEHGKKAVAWNDLLRGEALPNDFMIQAWMGDKKYLLDYINRGGKIIQSSTECYYLDYPYFMIDAQKILEYNPYPEFFQEIHKESLLGIECPLWSERIPDLKTAAYLLFPRLPAMAEVAWSGQLKDNKMTFMERYDATKTYLEQLGLEGAPKSYWHMDDATAKADKEHHEYVVGSPENLEAEAHDEALMAEERAIYGDER